MRTEEEIEKVIEHYKERKTDHHILLNTPLIQSVIFAHLDTIIATLEWALGNSKATLLDEDGPQSLESKVRKENE